MYCKHCSREIDDNSSYCKYCGKPQGNINVSRGWIIDFIYKHPIITFYYVLWVIINTVCLLSGEKHPYDFDILYPKYNYSNSYDYEHYLITDYIVYVLLIPYTIYLGYYYFKKGKSITCRICWTLWFIFHIYMYSINNFEMTDFFNLFTLTYISYDNYDLTELVFYTMIIPIAYWGYLYYKDKKVKPTK